MRDFGYAVARKAATLYVIVVLLAYLMSTAFRDALRGNWFWFLLVFLVLYGLARWARPRLELYTEYPEPDEQETINNIIELLISRLKDQYPDDATLRDTHPKSDGLVRGTFKILDDLPPEFRIGLFAEPREYDCWIRFSNAADELTKDRKRDFRGLAIKLFEVEGDKLQDDEEGTFDFLFIGHDTFFAKNAKEFLSFFAHITFYPRLLGQLLYFLPRPRNLWNTIRGRQVFGNPLEINWFGVAPYRFGRRVVKYHIPEAIPPVPPLRSDPDYLRHRLEASLKEQDWVLDFMIQFQLDPYKQPIESTLHPWKTRHTPFHKIAEIHIPAQTFSSDAQRAFDESMTFNPWHCTPDHRPIGGINRARRDVMRAIQEFRLQQNGKTRTDVVNTGPDDAPAS